MCHLHPSNKGWLRQYIPQPTYDQMDRFERLVEQWMLGIKNPNHKQIEKARMVSYQRMMGVVA